MTTIKVNLHPAKYDVKVKPSGKLASLALFDTALLTIYNQAKETIKRTTNGKTRN